MLTGCWPAQVKSYLQILPKGVVFCHANNNVHWVSPSGLRRLAPEGSQRGPHVSSQGCGSRGGILNNLFTSLTFEGLLSCVHSHVGNEMGAPAE